MAGGSKWDPGALSAATASILRSRMGERNITHTALGKAVGVSRQQIDGIVADPPFKHVDIEQLDRICFALGLDLIKDVITVSDQKSSGRQIGWGVTPLVRK